MEEVLEPFDEPYEPHEIIQNKKDLYINKFYCSKKDKLKNNFSENCLYQFPQCLMVSINFNFIMKKYMKKLKDIKIVFLIYYHKKII